MVENNAAPSEYFINKRKKSKQMQKTISIKNIEYSIHERPILAGISFICSEDERLCILGENGAGKSTLLKIMCGFIEPDNGVVEKNGHIRSVYVSQEFDPKFKEESIETYIKEMGGATKGTMAIVEKAYKRALELGYEAEKNKDRLCGSLSGGQQKILALATAFAVSPDFLFLDEPENHIDIVSRVVLTRMLQDYRGGIIFISHDRLIIDAIATKVAEIAKGEMHISEGGYSDYIDTKMKRIGGLQRQYDSESKRIKQLESTVVILKQKALRGKEISAYRRKQDELDELKAAHKDSPRPDDKKTKIRISQNEKGLHGGKMLCKIVDGSFKYKGSKTDMFKGVHLEARSGSNIVLVGRNGSGKSTFLKCLTGNQPLTKGTITWGNEVKWAYFDQHAEFDPGEIALNIVCKKLNCLPIEGRSVMGAMRFSGDRMDATVGSMSGGERMRLRFAIVFGLKPDLLILDEPTNHIDEVTWEVLLEACKASKSTILLVSHDYEFCEAFEPDVFWMMKDNSVVERYKDLPTLLKEMGA